MTTFAERQATRDALAESLPSLPVGDECRRWSTCDRCSHKSSEMRYLVEQIDWEDDHAVWGCDPEPEPQPIDIDLNIWPAPTEWTFTREYAELGATVHVHRPHSHKYTPHRIPAALKKHVA